MLLARKIDTTSLLLPSCSNQHTFNAAQLMVFTASDPREINGEHLQTPADAPAAVKATC